MGTISLKYVHPTSWGNTIQSSPSSVVYIDTQNAERIVQQTKPPILPYGMGRSYGDVCLNNGGALLCTQRMDRIIECDTSTGRIKVESGVSISHLLNVVVPIGWFIPVIPGTSHITIGGAVANDVHGKNHHTRGSFGCHVTALELVRSDGSTHRCSLQENEGLFRATIGGMGLTGLITWVEFQLLPIPSAFIEVQSTACTSWQQLIEVLHRDDENWEYTVAWVDARRGRGHVLAGRHQTDGDFSLQPARKYPLVPILQPLLTDANVDLFNQLKFAMHRSGVRRRREFYKTYFHPLDVMPNWNRLYGTRGFLQYQFVVPTEVGAHTIGSVMQILHAHSVRPYLSVLKAFGDRRSPGMLSFPMQGLTLAMDIPNNDARVYAALEKCDELVVGTGGRIYPAKDARMSSDTFARMYQNTTEGSSFTQGTSVVHEFRGYVDPHFSSSLWRRVSGSTI